jgi:hypothetical protein
VILPVPQRWEATKDAPKKTIQSPPRDPMSTGSVKVVEEVERFEPAKDDAITTPMEEVTNDRIKAKIGNAQGVVMPI